MLARTAAMPRSEINITPLVDVVLVLLIIFMVASPLLTYGFEVSIPRPVPNPPTSPANQLVVSMTSEGKLLVGGIEVTRVEFRHRLAEILQKRSNKTVLFAAEDGVNYGEALAIVDILRQAGAEHIGVVLDSQPQVLVD